jgi:hypothetical protein
LSQSGAITYLDEASKGAMPGGQTSIDVTRLSIGPELKRRVDMSSGLSVEPFAFFKSSLDLPMRHGHRRSVKTRSAAASRLPSPTNTISGQWPISPRA